MVNVHRASFINCTNEWCLVQHRTCETILLLSHTQHAYLFSCIYISLSFEPWIYVVTLAFTMTMHKSTYFDYTTAPPYVIRETHGKWLPSEFK